MLSIHKMRNIEVKCLKGEEMDIINNIISIMNTKDITAYQLEKDNIIKQTTFNSWKKGSQPALDKIIKLIRYFEVSPNELFGYDNINLSENEKELLELFNKLPEREQIKLIGKLEQLTESL